MEKTPLLIDAQTPPVLCPSPDVAHRLMAAVMVARELARIAPQVTHAGDRVVLTVTPEAWDALRAWLPSPEQPAADVWPYAP